MEKQRPKVGVAVYILNDKNQVLLMLRKNVVGAGTWCPPGGHLEMGEELVDCVKRECKEEVDLDITEANLWSINNNIMQEPYRHYVNLDFLVTNWRGQYKNSEPEKCETVDWFDLSNLPELFESTNNFFERNPNCLCRSGKKFIDCHGSKI